MPTTPKPNAAKASVTSRDGPEEEAVPHLSGLRKGDSEAWRRKGATPSPESHLLALSDFLSCVTYEALRVASILLCELFSIGSELTKCFECLSSAQT